MKRFLAIPLLFFVFLSACSTKAADEPRSTAAPTDSGATVSCRYDPAPNAVKKVDLPPTDQVPATGRADYVLTLNGTDLRLSLDQERTPCTTNSFRSLAQQGFFDGTACHRLVDSGGLYVLQCGDPSGSGAGGPGYMFADELSGQEAYGAGTLAMANAGPGTNGSQFFIVYADSQLPPNYTVFGQLDEPGVAAIAELAKAGQDNTFGAAGGGKPNQPAVIDGIKPAN